MGIQPLSLVFDGCPFLNIVIGSPLFPADDQLLAYMLLDLAVLPNLKLLPYLPSCIISPSKGSKGLILDLATYVAWLGLIVDVTCISGGSFETTLTAPNPVCV